MEILLSHEPIGANGKDTVVHRNKMAINKFNSSSGINNELLEKMENMLLLVLVLASTLRYNIINLFTVHNCGGVEWTGVHA